MNRIGDIDAAILFLRTMFDGGGGFTTTLDMAGGGEKNFLS